MNEREIPAETASSNRSEKIANVAALGIGVQGVVKLVKRKRDEKLLARKKIRYRESRYLEPKHEFLKNFSHANIIEFVACEYDRDQSSHLFCMDLLAFFSQRKNAVTENVLWQVLFQVASALSYCHHGVGIYGDHFTVEEEWDGIIHGGIKPSNVLVSFWENGRIVVKICNFGMSKEYITTLYGTSAGTCKYTEPDVSGGWSFKSDIFSLGRTTRALWGLNESLVISQKFEKVISKCEEKNRLQRFCAITLLHSIPAEYFHVPDGFQAKNSTRLSAEGPDISGFTGHLLASVANVGTETKRLQKLVGDLEGDEDLHSYYIDAVQYSLKHNYSTALCRIFELLREMVNVTADDGKTPLHFAAETGNLRMVLELVELGADVSAISQDGWTALHSAAENGHLEVVEKLVHLGADPRSTSQDGWTALHLTVKYGHLEVAQKILELELDLEILGYQRPEIHRSQPELRRRTPRKILSPGRSLKIP